MGAGTSKQATNKKSKKNLLQIIDYVARNFILTSNFQDMKKLSSSKYCNDLVTLTSDIIAKKLNSEEIAYLSQRIKDGVEKNIVKKDKIIFLKKKNLDKLDVSNDTTKKRMCIGIAKFYVRIAHIFAAIVTTINPVYTYRKENGEKEGIPLLQTSSLPEGYSKIEELRTKNNICSTRINTLLNNNSYDVKENERIVVQPNFCEMNIDKKSRKIKVLTDEPGIPHLEELYNNVYDLNTGMFSKMDDKMRDETYQKDLLKFYKAFTGKDKIPTNSEGKPVIQSFKDIELKDYHASRGCTGFSDFTSVPLYKRKYVGKNTGLFEKYATHVKNMMKSTEENRDKLIEIIDEIFVYGVDENNPQKKRYSIIINPKLTDSKLEDITDRTRNIIVSLYLTCENDFAKGVNIFEAIVEKNELSNNREYLDSLKKNIDTKIQEKQDMVDLEERSATRESAISKARKLESLAKVGEHQMESKVKEAEDSARQELEEYKGPGYKDERREIHEAQEAMKDKLQKVRDLSNIAKKTREDLEKKTAQEFKSFEEEEDNISSELQKKGKDVEQEVASSLQNQGKLLQQDIKSTADDIKHKGEQAVKDVKDKVMRLGETSEDEVKKGETEIGKIPDMLKEKSVQFHSSS